MGKTKTIRIHVEARDKMNEVRSPGETDAELIDRAIGLLAEVKTIAREFCESREYQGWLARNKQREGG